MSEREDYVWGFITGVLILGAFRIAWFLLKLTWWLLVFMMLSLGAGIVALTRVGRSEPDTTVGFGQYSEDRTRWKDEASGQWYPCSQTDREYCEVKAADAGFYWRKTALMRLLKRGALVRSRFFAVRKGTSELVSEQEFPQEARHNITLDHLDPATASTDIYNLSVNRESAKDALRDLDWRLTKTGWQPAGRSDDHWYAKLYERPVILREQPIGGATTPELAT